MQTRPPIHSRAHRGSYLFKAVHVIAQGLIVLVLGAWLPGWTPAPDEGSAKWFQSGALFAALYIVALGTGGIKPNVSAFGADQLDVTDPQVQPWLPYPPSPGPKS